MSYLIYVVDALEILLNLFKVKDIHCTFIFHLYSV